LAFHAREPELKLKLFPERKLSKN